MNLTSFLQDKRLMIALKGDIDHHGAKDVMRVLGNKIDLYLAGGLCAGFPGRDVHGFERYRHHHLLHPPYARAARRGDRGERAAAADEGAPRVGLEQIVKIEERGLVYES